MNVTPLHDRLIVQRLDEGEQRVGGIIVPDSAKEKPQRGKVFAVGQGKVKEDGSRQPPDVKSGDTILFGKIKVGAATETEMKEKKARVEDAMHATKAAVEEGIVAGGGVALLRAGKALDGLKLTGDELVGLQIVRRAIEEPMRHIATNAGAEGSIVVSKVKDMKLDEGFNAATEVYEDLVKAGVIDPAKVVRSALQNASSIASLLLTTDALISETVE